MRTAWIAATAWASIVLGACGGAGLGKGVRDDVSARVAEARDPIAGCYEAALAKNRKLAGTIVVSFSAAPSTGQFEDVQIVSDGVGDFDLAACVVSRLSEQKLAKPASTRVAISAYPLEFSPNN